MRIEAGKASRLEPWSAMRAALWPESSAFEHAAELAKRLAERSSRLADFLAVTAEDNVVGFAEVSLRRDYVNGCDTSPVAFLEGIYVTPERRRTGVARRLVTAAEALARQAGCVEFASDALLDNRDSHAFHQAAGFAETERVVYFRKALDPA